MHKDWLGPPRFCFSLEQGNKAIYFRGTMEQKSKTESNRETKAIFGNSEHSKSLSLPTLFLESLVL